MRTLQSGSAFITVVANGGTEARTCNVQAPAGFSPRVLWGDASAVTGATALGARGTAVAVWERKK